MSGITDTMRKIHTKLRQAQPTNLDPIVGDKIYDSREKFDEKVWRVEDQIQGREEATITEPTVIPDEEDPRLSQARKKAAARRRQASGRTSTVLTGDTLG